MPISHKNEVPGRARQEGPPGTAAREPRVRIKRYGKRRSSRTERAIPCRHHSLRETAPNTSR